MELERYWGIVRRWWWLLLAAVLVAAVSSYIGTTRMPRIYRAAATVMIGQALQKSNPSSMDLWMGEQLAKTYADMVRRHPIRKATADALGLPFVPSPGSISARPVEGTQLLEISVVDTDPERARVIADEIVHQLILQTPTESSGDSERQQFIQQQLQDLESSILETTEEIDAEQTNLDNANSARAIQQHQNNLAALQQKLGSYQSTYSYLLQAVQGGVNYITVIEPAITPTRPISPKVPETVMLAAAIGAVLAAGGAFLIEYMDDTLKTPGEITRAVNLPVLGTITRIYGEGYSEKLIAAQHPRSPITESYRSLRTNIQFSLVDRSAHTLMVTSPNPVEGKSVTLTNLATVMAQSGLSVIAVDADMRRPVMHKAFGLPNEHGLSSAILKSNPGVVEHIQPTGIENLSVVTSGPLPPNPAELLGSESMKEVIKVLAQRADVVLFDSPPVLAVTDAAVLSTLVDGVLMVNDAGNTRRAQSQRAVASLQRVGAKLLGVVLNRMSTGRGGYYYSHYYYQSDDESGGRRDKKRRRKMSGRKAWFRGLRRAFRRQATDESSETPGG